MKPIELNRFENIVAIVPQNAFGPGWTNKPLWIYIENVAEGTYRRICLQVEEQSIEMQLLFNIGSVVHESLLGAVKTIKTDPMNLS